MLPLSPLLCACVWLDAALSWQFHGGGGGKMHSCFSGNSKLFLPGCMTFDLNICNLPAEFIKAGRHDFVWPYTECKDQWQDRCDYQKTTMLHSPQGPKCVSEFWWMWPQTSSLLSYLINLWLSALTLITKLQRHTSPNFTLCNTRLLACLLFSQNWSTVFMSLYSSDQNWTPSKGSFSAIFRNFKSGYSKPLYTVTDL